MNANARSTQPRASSPTLRLVAATALAVVGAALSGGGCGGGMSDAVSPSDSVGSAVQEVDAAEARIGAALGMTIAPPPDTAEPVTPTPTTPPTQPTPQPTSPGPTTAVDPPDRMSTDEERCHVACDALTSLLRAVDRLCTLTGQTDERCQDRRARADRASARVVQSCPSCNV